MPNITRQKTQHAGTQQLSWLAYWSVKRQLEELRDQPGHHKLGRRDGEVSNNFTEFTEAAIVHL